MMSTIEVVKADITELDVDAIVNAANPQLLEGGGVCGAIFKKAGFDMLREACSRIGGCDTGGAVITPGFNLKAKYVIHAVGPLWHGGNHNEARLLHGAYWNSLILAKENGCSSIAFPVISSGIYGYPKNQAWEIAVRSCADFITSNPDYEVRVVFAVLSEKSLELGESVIGRFI